MWLCVEVRVIWSAFSTRWRTLGPPQWARARVRGRRSQCRPLRPTRATNLARRLFLGPCALAGPALEVSVEPGGITVARAVLMGDVLGVVAGQVGVVASRNRAERPRSRTAEGSWRRLRSAATQHLVWHSKSYPLHVQNEPGDARRNVKDDLNILRESRLNLLNQPEDFRPRVVTKRGDSDIGKLVFDPIGRLQPEIVRIDRMRFPSNIRESQCQNTKLTLCFLTAETTSYLRSLVLSKKCNLPIALTCGVAKRWQCNFLSGRRIRLGSASSRSVSRRNNHLLFYRRIG